MDVTTDEREQVLDQFRRWGYLQASVDPLGVLRPAAVPELDIADEAAEFGRRIYCGSIGVEFMHIPDRGKRQWIQERMESTPPAPDRRSILEQLVRAEIFEEVLQSYYPGTKRFSLEGVAALIPLVHTLLRASGGEGASEAVIGMSHRGRLNVMVQIVGKSPAEILAAFEDVDPRSVLGGGDVKYHVGATGEYRLPDGRMLAVRLVSNPSHLEAVDPVVFGRVRAKQTRVGRDGERRIVPILLHGDGAFAGQGIAAETLNLTAVDGFSVGGAVHVIVNNLIGFTAKPEELHSSRFSSDLARRLPVPIFHVNGEDPDAVVRAAAMAAAYRYAFGSGVVIDLVGFRRHGHSEIDDPTMTQPLLYRAIQQHPPLWRIYSEGADVTAGDLPDRVRAEYGAARDAAATMKKNPRLGTLPEYWNRFDGGRYSREAEVDTGMPEDRLKAAAEILCRIPEGFAVHPKVKRILDRRRLMGSGKNPVDFGLAEALAFATLVEEGVPVRLSGQDSRRGTFGQRHAVLIDVQNEREYIPLQHIRDGQGRFEIYNSPLSEAAILGFEYGFSRDYPEALVLWEAQFGDFANGAQVIIDQFIAAGEDKWDLLSGIVLLLPHGYEGQGPEHSSARLERFLQLAAEDNLQVCQPSTAAQYFHLLRRQALRAWRKPLVVLTPKSLLRSSEAASPLGEFAVPRFRAVLGDPEITRGARVLLCSGKVAHELRRERKRKNNRETAIITLEQFYPFPEEELASELDCHREAKEYVWVQEEPANMGALSFILPRIESLAGGRPVRSVKRSVSASPATGSAKAHELEQRALLELAFGPIHS